MKLPPCAHAESVFLRNGEPLLRQLRKAGATASKTNALLNMPALAARYLLAEPELSKARRDLRAGPWQLLAGELYSSTLNSVSNSVACSHLMSACALKPPVMAALLRQSTLSPA